MVIQPGHEICHELLQGALLESDGGHARPGQGKLAREGQRRHPCRASYLSMLLLLSPLLYSEPGVQDTLAGRESCKGCVAAKLLAYVSTI
jgi:hypothetical protein